MLTANQATSTLPPHIFNLMASSAMEEARRLVENKKGISKFEWRGASKRLFSNTDREVVMSGPAGSSKSMSCLARLHQLALDTPGFRGLIVRNTRSSLSETGLVTFEQNILGLDHPMLRNGPRRQWRNDYRYDNGAIIVIGGMDKPSKVLSGEYDVIYVQQAEELTEDAWETLITRLRNYKLSFQQMIGDCNPASPTHWLKRRADTGAATMLESRHEDNPLLWDDKKGEWTDIGKDYLSKLDSLTGVRLQRLRFGRWVAAEGMIYEDWDRAVHIIDPFPIPREWKRFRTIDFGYTAPLTVQWWAVDDDGRMYLYREFYHTKKTVREVAQVIKRYEKWHVLNPDGTPRKDDNGNLVPDPRREPIYVAVCDHDAEDRATLEAEGIATVPADKRITVGIQATQHRLKQAGDGRSRLFILRGALVYSDPELIEVKKPLSVEQEIDSYVWMNKANKDVPLGKDDHGCFVAGTQVLTDKGWQAIEAVQVGQHALTRKGWRTVIDAAQTSANATVYTVEMSNGQLLTGTGNHPVWVKGQGYIDLRALRYGDILGSVHSLFGKENDLWLNPILSSTRASSSDDTRTRATGATRCTTDPTPTMSKQEYKPCIERSTKTTTGQFLMGMKFTISTATPPTIPLLTSLLSTSTNTSAFTQKTYQTNDSSRSENKWIERERSPLCGTSRQKDEHGIAKCQKHPGWTDSQEHTPVSNAELSTLLCTQAHLASVPMPVNQHGDDHRESMTKLASVFNAAKTIGATVTPRRAFAPIYVVSVVEEAQKQAIYNLTVDDASEYYANGVLVHNCDALRYAVMYLDAPGVFGFDKISGASLKDKSPNGGGVAPRNWNPTGVQVPTGNRKWSV